MFHRIGIYIITISALIQPCATADELDPTAAKVLKAFAGTREVVVTMKPSKWFPEQVEEKIVEVMTPILQNRFILGRAYRNGVWDSFFLIGYDTKTKEFPFTFFGKDLYGTHWSGTWDEASATLNSKATDTPPGWTSAAVNKIVDADHVDAAAWMKDEAGTLLLDATYKKKRLAESPDPQFTKWPSKYPAGQEPPAELKVLERMAGRWNAELIYAPAEWTPAEKKETRKANSQLVIEGKFVFTMTQDSDGLESLFVTCYDPQAKLFKMFRFTSKGDTLEMSGTWDEVAGSLTLKSKINDLDFRIVQRFIDLDNYDWRGMVNDANGKVYFDMTGKANRNKD